MVEYLSGQLNFGGLTENTNFTELREKLYAIESRKATQLFRWKADWARRVEGFQKVRTSLAELQKQLKAMSNVDTFLVKKAISGNESVATARAGAKVDPGVYNIEVNQLARSATWSKETSFADKNAVVNAGPGTGTFAYTYKGQSRTVNVPPNTTLEGLKNLINNDSKNPGVKVQLISTTEGMMFQVRGKDTGSAASLTIDSTAGIDQLDMTSTPRWTTYTGNYNPLAQYYTGINSVVNNTSSPQDFILDVNGTQTTINLPAGATLADLNTAINNSGANATSSIYYTADGRYFLQMTPSTPGESVSLTMDSPNVNGIMAVETFSSMTDVVNNTSAPQTLRFSVNGKETVISLPAGATVKDMFNAINAKSQSSGARAVMRAASSPVGGMSLSLEAMDPSASVLPGNGSLVAFSDQPASSNWLIQNSSNATIRVNGWPEEPKWMEVPSNTVDDIVEGLTFNLRSTGKTTVTVNIDSTAIAENVAKFVDSVNAFYGVIKELTQYDDSKNVLKPEYAESQFEMQKGSVLTGNYGVQLLVSRIKSTVAGSAPGFQYKKDDTGMGDTFTALSQIGITTNADQGSDLFGMLEIMMLPDNDKGSLTLEQAINKDPMAVARLFSAVGEGVSSSPAFGHVSHVSGVTKNGSYEVNYNVAADGTVTGTINGKEAVYDPVTHQLGIYSNTPPPNPADGLVIEIYDFTLDSSFSGEVSIRQGKVNELLDMMSGSEGMLGKNGALTILEDNYKKIMSNIDEKLDKENDRLAKWSRVTQARFARLEAIIAKYQRMNEDIKSQISQLPKADKK